MYVNLSSPTTAPPSPHAEARGRVPELATVGGREAMNEEVTKPSSSVVGVSSRLQQEDDDRREAVSEVVVVPLDLTHSPSPPSNRVLRTIVLSACVVLPQCLILLLDDEAACSRPSTAEATSRLGANCSGIASTTTPQLIATVLSVPVLTLSRCSSRSTTDVVGATPTIDAAWVRQRLKSATGDAHSNVALPFVLVPDESDVRVTVDANMTSLLCSERVKPRHGPLKDDDALRCRRWSVYRAALLKAVCVQRAFEVLDLSASSTLRKRLVTQAASAAAVGGATGEPRDDAWSIQERQAKVDCTASSGLFPPSDVPPCVRSVLPSPNSPRCALRLSPRPTAVTVSDSNGNATNKARRRKQQRTVDYAATPLRIGYAVSGAIRTLQYAAGTWGGIMTRERSATFVYLTTAEAQPSAAELAAIEHLVNNTGGNVQALLLAPTHAMFTAAWIDRDAALRNASFWGADKRVPPAPPYYWGTPEYKQADGLWTRAFPYRRKVLTQHYGIWAASTLRRVYEAACEWEFDVAVRLRSDSYLGRPVTYMMRPSLREEFQQRQASLVVDIRRDRGKGGLNDQFFFGPPHLYDAAADAFLWLPHLRVSGAKPAEWFFRAALVQQDVWGRVVRGPWRFTDLIRFAPLDDPYYYPPQQQRQGRRVAMLPKCCPFVAGREAYLWRVLPNGTLCQCLPAA